MERCHVTGCIKTAPPSPHCPLPPLSHWKPSSNHGVFIVSFALSSTELSIIHQLNELFLSQHQCDIARWPWKALAFQVSCIQASGGTLESSHSTWCFFGMCQICWGSHMLTHTSAVFPRLVPLTSLAAIPTQQHTFISDRHSPCL